MRDRKTVVDSNDQTAGSLADIVSGVMAELFSHLALGMRRKLSP